MILIAKRHPNNFSDIKIEPDKENDMVSEEPSSWNKLRINFPVRGWTPPNACTEKKNHC
ncbi:hypothetical protein ACHWQZ_G005418 [Mnemiopsis leidyi]